MSLELRAPNADCGAVGSGHGGGAMNAAMRFTSGAAVVLLLGVLATRLALGPIHAVRNAAECERAYAQARTHSDSLSVTYLSYPDAAARGMRHRCGELRAAVVSAPGR